MKKSILSLAVLTCGLFSLTANAAVSWDITTTAGDNITPAPAYGNTRSYSTSAVSVDVKAFAATAGTNTTTTSDSSRNSRLLETAYLANYASPNGLGVVNRDSSNTAAVAVTTPTGADGSEYVNGGSEHAMDNNGRSEVMLLTFSEAVALKSLTVGWPAMGAGTDTDLFVLAWIGGGNPTAALTTSTFASISTDSADGGNGWTLVSNLSNVVTSSTNIANNFNNSTIPVSSSYWLIGTGGFASAATGGGVTSGDQTSTGAWKPFGSTTSSGSYDYVKLAGIGGTKIEPPGNSVPEPGTLGLAGLALFGITALRRKKSTQ